MAEKTILAAIDGSDFSKKVLDKAIEYARLLEAGIVLVYCHRKFPKILGQPHRDHIISAIMDETELVVGPFKEKLDSSGLEYVERFMEGPAGTMIPNVAAHEKCEMIVMGSRGRSDLEGLVLGSVAHKVLHLATCPVLIIK